MQKRTMILQLGSMMLCSAAFGSQLQVQSKTGLDFQKGDAVRIAVWRDPSREGGNLQVLGLNDDYTIDNKGSIDLPLIGSVRALGLSRDGLAAAIKEKYGGYISDLIVICTPLIRITVTGAVQKPGSYLVESKSSLWDLIDLAGGPSNNADFRKMKVERGGRTVAKNLLLGFEKAVSLEDLRLQSGDQVILPARSGITVRSVIDYTSFALSVAGLYLQILNRTR